MSASTPPGAVVVAALCAVGAVLVGTPSPASAAPLTEVVQGRYLRLVSVADWDAAAHLAVGAAVRWDVTVSADAPSPGRVGVSVEADGTMPLTIDARVCGQPWVEESCPGGAVDLRAGWQPPLEGTRTALISMADTDVVHLRLDVARAVGGGEDAARTTLRVYAAGAGDEVGVGPGGGELATTGASPAALLTFGGLAALLIVAGVVALEQERRRSGRGSAGRRS